MHTLNRTQVIWLVLFLALWALYGLTGRDAWKSDEALALGQLLDWRTAGQVFGPGAAPLYTWAADHCATGLQAWLAPQDGARFASAGFALLAFLFVGLAARAILGPGYEAAAILAMVGSLGLMLRAHALLPEIAILMAHAMLLYGIGAARLRPRGAGLAVALGLFTLGFMRGWTDLASGLLIVLISQLSREWRVRSLRIGMAGGLAAILLVLVVTTVTGGQTFAAWWTMGTGFLGTLRPFGTVLGDLSWFAWPVWPLAIWAIWHDHRRLDREFSLHPLLAATLVLLVWAHWPAYSREGGLMAVLVPLSLLAAKGLANLKRGAAQALYWFGVLTFLFFAIVFWGYYMAIEWGWPARAAAHMAYLTPAYVAGGVTFGALLLAGAATLFWMVAIPLFPRAKVRPVLVWATGMSLTWILMFGLFRGWADAGWGYRQMLGDMVSMLPAHACLRTEVEPDLAPMLRYHFPERYRPDGACDYWLISGAPNFLERDGRTLHPLWSGSRPRQKRDVYTLYLALPN